MNADSLLSGGGMRYNEVLEMQQSGSYKEVRMSETWRGAKMDAAKVVKDETGQETVEVTEAIKALQLQLADLRKIVQAAKSSDDSTIEPGRRQ